MYQMTRSYRIGAMEVALCPSCNHTLTISIAGLGGEGRAGVNASHRAAHSRPHAPHAPAFPGFVSSSHTSKEASAAANSGAGAEGAVPQSMGTEATPSNSGFQMPQPTWAPGQGSFGVGGQGKGGGNGAQVSGVSKKHQAQQPGNQLGSEVPEKSVPNKQNWRGFFSRAGSSAAHSAAAPPPVSCEPPSESSGQGSNNRRSGDQQAASSSVQAGIRLSNHPSPRVP
jgi:hypothetical protein